PRSALQHCTRNTSLSKISGTVSLSFQSAFHLSLTVLVRYRSPVNIWPWKKFTSQFGMQSQASLLCHQYRTCLFERTFTLYGLSFQRVTTALVIGSTTIQMIGTLSTLLFTRRY